MDIRKYERQWKKCLKAGCYPYALDMRINEFALIGDFIGKRCTWRVSDEVLIDTLIKELDFLEIKVRKSNLEEVVKKGEIKIYLERDTMSGYYHFSRQDASGIWTHKEPGKTPQKLPEKFYKAGEEDELYFDTWCFIIKK